MLAFSCEFAAILLICSLGIPGIARLPIATTAAVLALMVGGVFLINEPVKVMTPGGSFADRESVADRFSRRFVADARWLCSGRSRWSESEPTI